MIVEDMLGHARLYLALGFAVLPVHYPYERDGRRQCSCGRDDCGQPAKHPFGRLVKAGVKDATKDPRVSRAGLQTPPSISASQPGR